MAKSGPGKRGRPSSYKAKTAAIIIEMLCDGAPLEEICRMEGMPASRTVSDWKAAHPDFSTDFARARISGFHAIANRTRNTARGKGPGDGGDSTGDVQRDKLIIETDLKLLAKWFPPGYGDKVALTGGSKDDEPIRTEASVRLDNLTRDQLAQLLSIADAASAAGGDTGGDSEEGP
jgi:hypothetical protein